MTCGILLHALAAYAPLVSKMGGPPGPNQVIIVRPDDNLTAVVDYAAAGDTLLLSDGTYKLDVTLTIDKDITLAAQNSGRAVLDGQQKVRVLHIKGGNVSVSGINITGGHGEYGGGVMINGGTTTFDSCNIHGNTATYGGGGGVYISSGTVDFQNCNIYSNTAYYGGGVVIYGGTTTFDSCNIHGNTATYGGGAFIQDIQDGTVNFQDCNIYGNAATSGGGVYVDDGNISLSSCNVTNNTAQDHGGGIYVDKDASNPPKLDDKCVVSNDTPDNCYGFWSSPACFGSLLTLALHLEDSK